MDNPTIRIAAKFQYKLPLLRTLVVTGTQSHGLEVVHIEKVLLPYKALEAGRLQFMWTLFSTLTWEKGAENRSVECLLIFIIVIVVECYCYGYFIIVIVIDDDTYYGALLVLR